MSDATHAPPPHPDGQAVEENPEVAFEPRDANIRVIVVTGVILVIVAVIIHLLLWWMFNLLDAHHDSIKRARFPLVQEGRNQPPEGPPLEGIQAVNGSVFVQRRPGEPPREFAIDEPIVVTRNGKATGPDGRTPLNIFDLGVGTDVTVVYEPPTGHEPTQEPTTPVAKDRVITIEAPPEEDTQTHVFGPHRLAFSGRLTRLDAISPEYRHFLAEVDLNRPAGWLQGQEGKVAHIPIEQAMALIAEQDGGGKAGKAPNDALPGAAPVGGRP